jgi:hypothetical protein
MFIHEALTMKASIKHEKTFINHLSKKAYKLSIHRQKRNREKISRSNSPQVAIISNEGALPLFI